MKKTKPMPKKKGGKMFAASVMALLSAAMALPAFAICTSATVTSTAATVLAANTSSTPRRQLWIQGSASVPAWCDIGTTAVVGSGFFIYPATIVPIPAAQQSSNTFPQAPNGAVSCILPKNMPANSTLMSACAN